MDILARYSILNKFGSSYTFENLENVPFLHLQYMQLCMTYENKALELKQKRMDATYHGH